MLEAFGSYELLKTGFYIIMMCSFFCAASLVVTTTILTNYESVPGNITLNADKLTETLIYTVNGKQYTKTINPIATTNNNITTTIPALNIGSCTVYYVSGDPDNYSINFNPKNIKVLFTSTICCLITCALICSISWFTFLRSNPGAAGVIGGIDATDTVVSSIFSR